MQEAVGSGDIASLYDTGGPGFGLFPLPFLFHDLQPIVTLRAWISAPLKFGVAMLASCFCLRDD